jgi:hypothetical protein
MFSLLILCGFNMCKLPKSTPRIISFKKTPAKLPHIQAHLQKHFCTDDVFHIALGSPTRSAAGIRKRKFAPRPKKADTTILVSDGSFSFCAPEATLSAPSKSAIISPYDIVNAQLPQDLALTQSVLKLSFVFQERQKSFNTYEHLRIFGVYRTQTRPKLPPLQVQGGQLSTESFHVLDYVRDIAPISVQRYVVFGYGKGYLPIESSSKNPLIMYAKGRYTKISFEGSKTSATSLKNGAMAIVPPRTQAILSISQSKNPAAYLSLFMVTFTNSGYFPGFLSG